MTPASVRALLTAPVLCAKAVPVGRPRASISLSWFFLRMPSISSHAVGDTAFFVAISSSRPVISRAVVEPRPYFLVRAGSTEVVPPLKTLALIRVSGKPRVAIVALVAGMVIASRTMFVAVLSDTVIISRTASSRVKVAPGVKLSVSTPAPGTVSSLVSVSLWSYWNLRSSKRRKVSTMTASLMRLAVGITSSPLRKNSSPVARSLTPTAILPLCVAAIAPSFAPSADGLAGSCINSAATAIQAAVMGPSFGRSGVCRRRRGRRAGSGIRGRLPRRQVPRLRRER